MYCNFGVKKFLLMVMCNKSFHVVFCIVLKGNEQRKLFECFQTNKKLIAIANVLMNVI